MIYDEVPKDKPSNWCDYCKFPHGVGRVCKAVKAELARQEAAERAKKKARKGAKKK